MSPTPVEFIARGLIVIRGHALVCWNPKGQYGYLPGGHIESEEPAAVALGREMIEETGLACRVGPLLLTHENRFETRKRAHHEINLVFAAEIIDPSFLYNDEQVCHVAQSGKTAISSRQKGSRERKGAFKTGIVPPPIPSAEAHLAFKWLTAGQFGKAEILPGPMADWVLEVMESGLDSTVGLRPAGAPSSQWLSSMESE